MFIRRTLTRSLDSGEHYYSHRLVRSERTGGRVRQVTLLSLGRQFTLAPEQWPGLCTRIDALLDGRAGPTALECAPEVEREAQRLTALLLARQAESQPRSDGGGAQAMESVVAESLELVRARSVGVEQVALWAVKELRLVEALQSLGMAQRQVLAAVGMIAGRMAAPGAEQATRRWWEGRSAIGELLGVDFGAFGPMSLYRTGDSLLKRRQGLEAQLFAGLQDLCGLPPSEPIYDLTGACFEVSIGDRPSPRPGLVKEAPNDWPPVTLGLVLDGSGFVRRSARFTGEGAEGPTLKTMLDGLGAPAGALVAMDQGVASAANLAWLRANGYRFVAVRRGQARGYDPDRTKDDPAAGGSLERCLVLSPDRQEASLYCRSPERQAADEALAARRAARLEAGLRRLADGIAKPDGERDIQRLNERIDRLKEGSGPVGQQYRIALAADASGTHAVSLSWERLAAHPASRPALPGTFCLRSSETDWDAERMWRTYVALTDLHAALASLRPGPGLAPVDRPGEECTDAQLLVSVLACQCVQLARRRLKEKGIEGSWQTLRQILSSQCRVTVSLRCSDGRTLHLRSATRADPEQLAIYRALEIDPAPGAVQKTIV
jgi:hypothetical protein